MLLVRGMRTGPIIKERKDIASSKIISTMSQPIQRFILLEVIIF